MKTASTLLISTGIVAPLLFGASMTMRAPAPAEPGPARAAARVEQALPAQTWSEPPARTVAQLGSAMPVEHAGRQAMAGEAPEARLASAVPAHDPEAREASRRVLARTQTPKRAEGARVQRRTAQAAARARFVVARTIPAPRADAGSLPARPVDPISDFLRGVGLMDDGHG